MDQVIGHMPSKHEVPNSTSQYQTPHQTKKPNHLQIQKGSRDVRKSKSTCFVMVEVRLRFLGCMHPSTKCMGKPICCTSERPAVLGHDHSVMGGWKEVWCAFISPLNSFSQTLFLTDLSANQ
jgi:hypothetical protein